jgi:hypothetical protein
MYVKGASITLCVTRFQHAHYDQFVMERGKLDLEVLAPSIIH